MRWTEQDYWPLSMAVKVKDGCRGGGRTEWGRLGRQG